MVLVLQLQHLPISAHTIACARASQSLSSKNVNDRTDSCLIFHVQSCGMQLEPFLDIMAPIRANPLQKHTL